MNIKISQLTTIILCSLSCRLSSSIYNEHNQPNSPQIKKHKKNGKRKKLSGTQYIILYTTTRSTLSQLFQVFLFIEKSVPKLVYKILKRCINRTTMTMTCQFSNYVFNNITQNINFKQLTTINDKQLNIHGVQVKQNQNSDRTKHNSYPQSSAQICILYIQDKVPRQP